VIKRAWPAVLGLLALSLPVAAQQPPAVEKKEVIVREELEATGAVETGPALTLARADLFSSVDSTALIHSLPALTLLDGRRFPLSTELGRMGMSPIDLFPVAFLSAVEVQKTGSLPRYGSDGAGGVVNLRLNRMQTGGEVGFFYGKSGGKYGREDFSSYIIGGVGNDKFNITAGAAYHESSGHIPRGRR
jgi:outer membrane receptor protein involved in Fe transport